jgi:hypothetical protein
MNELELLHEGFKNEVDELESFSQHSDEYTLKAKRTTVNKQLGNIISNLNSLCDSLYREFENNTASEHQELQIKYSIVCELLKEKLSDDDKLYLRMKHNIDVEWGE